MLCAAIKCWYIWIIIWRSACTIMTPFTLMHVAIIPPPLPTCSAPVHMIIWAVILEQRQTQLTQNDLIQILPTLSLWALIWCTLEPANTSIYHTHVHTQVSNYQHTITLGFYFVQLNPNWMVIKQGYRYTFFVRI